MRIALLHGFAGDPDAWDDVIAEWPRGDDLRAIALPGHGAPIADSWDANLALVREAIGNVDLVIGYSLGARAALGLVASGHVARAILVSVNPGIADADRPTRRASDAAWARLLRERGIAAFVTAWEAQPLFATQARVVPDRIAARRARRLALDPGALATSLETMGLAEMPDYRAAVTADRTALVAGADDEKYVAIARTLPAPLTIIARAGHDPTLEQPAALAQVLTRTARAARRES
ncbi:MAG TPA: alpha/beta fold hydrolase [Kofleriaceae bacterium]|nr:alpha/beta fold hydrolase [Kofleriaceae bacterium]